MHFRPGSRILCKSRCPGSAGREFTVTTAAPIRLAGAELAETWHVCAFFNSDEEEYRVLLPFIKDGFACGERAFHVVNPDRREDHLQRLAAAGIDLRAAEQRGQFELSNNREWYLPEGSFNPDRVLAEYDQLATRNTQDGFLRTRIITHMDWAIGCGACLDDIAELESRINEPSRRRRNAAICIYPLAKLSGATVIDAMRTHPVIIIGGILHQNPFFVPPEDFLPELRRRRARAPTAP